MEEITCAICNNNIKRAYNEQFFCYNCPIQFPHIQYIEYDYTYGEIIIVSFFELDLWFFEIKQSTPKNEPDSCIKWIDISLFQTFIPYLKNNKIQDFLLLYNLLK